MLEVLDLLTNHEFPGVLGMFNSATILLRKLGDTVSPECKPNKGKKTKRMRNCHRLTVTDHGYG